MIVIDLDLMIDIFEIEFDRLLNCILIFEHVNGLEGLKWVLLVILTKLCFPSLKLWFTLIIRIVKLVKRGFWVNYGTLCIIVCFVSCRSNNDQTRILILNLENYYLSD